MISRSIVADLNRKRMKYTLHKGCCVGGGEDWTGETIKPQTANGEPLGPRLGLCGNDRPFREVAKGQ